MIGVDPLKMFEHCSSIVRALFEHCSIAIEEHLRNLHLVRNKKFHFLFLYNSVIGLLIGILLQYDEQ